MDPESTFAPEALRILQRKAALRQKEDEELCQLLRDKGHKVDLLDVQHELLKPYSKDLFEITRKVNPYNVFCELKKKEHEIAPPAENMKLTPEILSHLYQNLTEADKESLEEATKIKQQKKEARLLPNKMKTSVVATQIADYALIMCSRYGLDYYSMVGKSGKNPYLKTTLIGDNFEKMNTKLIKEMATRSLKGKVLKSNASSLKASMKHNKERTQVILDLKKKLEDQLDLDLKYVPWTSLVGPKEAKANPDKDIVVENWPLASFNRDYCVKPSSLVLLKQHSQSIVFRRKTSEEI